MIVRQMLAMLGLKVDGASFKKGDDAIDGSKKRLEGLTKVSEFAGKALATMAKVGAGAFVGLGIAAAKIGGDFESMRASLKTVTGSTEAAAAAFKTIQKFAASTPFGVKEVTSAFIKLKALGLDPSERALESYGNTSSAMGKSMSDMIEAVADAATGEFERLKEFGIKASSQGDQVSFTFQGITKTVGKNAKEIQEYLLAIGETQFAGAMSEQAKTFNGVLSNLGDTFESFLDSVAQNGLLDALKDVGREMGDISGDGDGLAKTLGKALGDAVRALWDAFKKFIPEIPRLVEQFTSLVGVAIKVVDIVSRIIEAVGGAEGLIYILLGLKVGIFGVDMAMKAMNATSAMGAASLGRMGLAFGALAIAAAGAIAIIDHYNDKIAELKAYQDELTGDVNKQRDATANALKGYTNDDLAQARKTTTGDTRAQVEAEMVRRASDAAGETLVAARGMAAATAPTAALAGYAKRRGEAMAEMRRLALKRRKGQQLSPSEKKQLTALQKELDITPNTSKFKEDKNFDAKGYNAAVRGLKRMGVDPDYDQLRDQFTKKKKGELSADEQLAKDFGNGISSGGKVVDRERAQLGTTINRIENRYDPKVTVTVQATQNPGEDASAFAERVVQIAQDTIERVVLRPGYDHFGGIVGA